MPVIPLRGGDVFSLDKAGELYRDEDIGRFFEEKFKLGLGEAFYPVMQGFYFLLRMAGNPPVRRASYEVAQQELALVRAGEFFGRVEERVWALDGGYMRLIEEGERTHGGVRPAGLFVYRAMEIEVESAERKGMN